ncbi:MAG: ABC transporter ATP-binding protein [Microgenomates group bacterium]
MKVVRRFFYFLGYYKLEMVAFMMMNTLSVVAESMRPWTMKMILDSAEANRQVNVYWYLGMLGVVVIGGNMVNALMYFLADLIKIPISERIRKVVFKKVLDLDFAYHVDKNTGSLISAFKRGDGAVDAIFSAVFEEIYWTIIYITIALWFLFRADTSIGVTLLGLFVINMGLIFWLIRKNLGKRAAFNKSEDEVSGIITDTMINYDTVKYFAAEKKEEKRLANKFVEWKKAVWDYSNTFRLMDISIGTVSATGMLIMLYLSISKLNKGLTLGDVIMVSGFVTSIHFQFFHLFSQIRSIAKHVIDLEVYFGILDNETTVKDVAHPKTISKSKGKIEFKNMSFVYPKNQQKVLDGINLVIKAGSKVAFVGRSGTGKTTLVKLLLRFYDTTRGKILIDGVDIKKMTKNNLRSIISVVPQEPVLFNNTIKYNLAYGREEATMEEILTVAEQANIVGFIDKLPSGWDTVVGERGIKLSGGQKQRLAIARALLTNPKVLVFDEATSNLDSESEKMIQVALEEVSKSRTVIIVAHRFSTVRDADNIVVLANGKIVEQGKHDKLLAKKGVYQKLWNLQTKKRNV